MTSKLTYKCNSCGLHYERRELAERCFAWCSTHDSCRLDVAKQSVEARARASRRESR